MELEERIPQQPSDRFVNNGFVLTYDDGEHVKPLATVRLYDSEVSNMTLCFIGLDAPFAKDHLDRFKIGNRGADIYRVADAYNVPSCVSVRIERDDSGDARTANMPEPHPSGSYADDGRTGVWFNA